MICKTGRHSVKSQKQFIIRLQQFDVSIKPSMHYSLIIRKHTLAMTKTDPRHTLFMTKSEPRLVKLRTMANGGHGLIAAVLLTVENEIIQAFDMYDFIGRLFEFLLFAMSIDLYLQFHNFRMYRNEKPC